MRAWWVGGGVRAYPLLLLSASIPVKALKSIAKIREPAALGAIQKERVTNLTVASPGFGGHRADTQCCQLPNYRIQTRINVLFPRTDTKKLAAEK